ncbi:MAG: hypothetical protein IJP74_04990 [Prevotella sp.]|nr:hypothetical protein [Prevotella sp.]
MRSLFFTIVFSVCAISLSAQPSLPNKVMAQMPSMLNSNILKVADLEAEFKAGGKWGQRKTEKRFWIVYSDRDQNVAYMEPTIGSALSPKKLSFGEQVVIAKIENNMALVYTDPKVDNFPEIPSYAKSIGWVPMENLLLWNICPSDNRGVLRKALIAINLNKIGQNETFHGKLYKHPTENTNPEDLKMDMHFYYVMKETPDGMRALLCLQSRLTGNNLYGWVNRNSYTPWDQRTCLEPNWDPVYVEKHKDAIANIYISDKLTDDEIVTHWKFGEINNVDRGNRNLQYRMAPALLRFPILSQPTNNAVKCTSFADRRGNINESVAYVSKGNEIVNEVEREMRKINIIFAVEATTEMSQYLPAIKASLAKCKSYANQGLTVQAGLVLYRAAANGSSAIDVIPLTNTDDARLLSMLDASKANGKLTGNARDVALPQAINIAIDASKMGFSKDQSNLLLVVGNRGAAEGDNSLGDQKLLKRLSDNNIQIMSIQVMRNEMGSWARYTDQMTDLVVKNVENQYKEINAEAKFSPSKDNDGYGFRSSRKEESVLFARIRFSKDMGKSLAPSAVTNYIDKGLDGFANSANTKKVTFEKAKNNLDFYPEFLKKILGERGYNSWKQVRAISSYDGYAKLKGADDSDYWHYIIYLSSGELEDLIAKLKATSEAAKMKSQDRTHYINAIRALLKMQLGDDDEKRINNMSSSELETAIYGLNIPTESMRFTKYSLKDMANSSVVKNPEYFEILDNFSKKYEELRRLQTGGYKYRLEVSNVYYYWIPIEMLP